MKYQSLLVFTAGILCCLLSLIPSTEADDSPFSPGTLKLETLRVTPWKDGCPLYTTIHYPKKPGNYTPLFFLGGFYDVMSSRFYHDFLSDIARHGYMVFGVDISPAKGEFPMRNERETESPPPAGSMHELRAQEQEENPEILPNFFKQMKWLENHVTNRTKSRPVWDKLTLSCHSASCYTILKIVMEYPHFAAAAAFLDPVCFNAATMKPKEVPTKLLSYTTAKSFEFPHCCVKGLSYRKVYQLMNTTKVRMSVRDFGHCGILDTYMWKFCNESGICHSGNQEDLPQYRLFASGMIHAFVRWTLFGEETMKPYVIDESLMPFALNDLAYSVDPHSMKNVDHQLDNARPVNAVPHGRWF